MKEFLSREGVSYQEKNVGIDQGAAQEMVSRSGQMGVPVTVLADQVIVGFDQSALKNAVSRLRAAKTNPTSGVIKLGAQVGDATKILGQHGQAARPGVILGAVRPGSLAAKAGLQEGDIITALNGQPTNSAEDLAKSLQTIAAGKLTRPSLTFWRDNQQLDSRLPIQF